MLRFISFSFVFISLGCTSGPGTEPLDFGGPDANKIVELVDDLTDTKATVRTWTPVFEKGSKPSDPKKFAMYSYTVVGKPSVNGASATAKIRIDDENAKQVGEMEWAFVKNGDKWKIKSAPLP